MKLEDKQKMLDMLEERLDSYTIEETIERLASYEAVGPTVEDFLDTIKTKDYLVCDCERNYGKYCLYDSDYLNGGCK